MKPRYLVIEQNTGEGGFGKVDKAQDQELERFIAIKTLDPVFKEKPSQEDIARFKKEAKILASLSHPNIPAVYDVEFSEQEREFKIISQWIEGINLRKHLTEKGPISLEEAKRWFSNICSALDHAHSKGIIHRDIKPANVIITQDNEACYLVDFGISLRKQDIERITHGTPPGTPGYMSPEQERGQELEASSDLYTLAIVLYESLSGNKPSIGDYKPLNSINGAIPPAVDDLIKDCLKEKQDRLKTSSEFVARLKSALTPHKPFTDILAKGSLSEIQVALGDMSCAEFPNLPKGQQILLCTRMKDLVKVDKYDLRNAVASLLAELVRVAQDASSDDYEFYVAQALQYGYETDYSDRWTGNSAIRIALSHVALESKHGPHMIISKQLLQFVGDGSRLEDKDKWYYHDLRILLQYLLANSNCTADNASGLGMLLERVNTISH